MVNHMEEVAKILNVEMGEEFKISGRKDTWKINEEGLVCKSKKGEWEPYNYNAILMLLLIGEEEIQKPILDDIEKEYLSGVIRPFRKKVKYITKLSLFNTEFIEIHVKNNNDNYVIRFPSFKKGIMYKGMKIGKEYSLEDLDLWINMNVL